MVNLWMKVDGEGWKKYICARIQECGRRAWKYGFNVTERENEYVRMKQSSRKSLADGSVGARVSLSLLLLLLIVSLHLIGRHVIRVVTTM